MIQKMKMKLISKFKRKIFNNYKQAQSFQAKLINQQVKLQVKQ